MKTNILILLIISILFIGCEDTSKVYKELSILKEQNDKLQKEIANLNLEIETYKNRFNNVKQDMFGLNNDKIFSNEKSCVLGNCMNGEGISKFNNLLIKGYFKDSFLINGKVTEYFSNKDIKSTVEFVNGFKNGKTIIYYSNGSKKYEANFVNDKMEGQAFYYNEDGTLAKEESYKEGNKIK